MNLVAVACTAGIIGGGYLAMEHYEDERAARAARVRQGLPADGIASADAVATVFAELPPEVRAVIGKVRDDARSQLEEHAEATGRAKAVTDAAAVERKAAEEAREDQVGSDAPVVGLEPVRVVAVTTEEAQQTAAPVASEVAPAAAVAEDDGARVVVAAAAPVVDVDAGATDASATAVAVVAVVAEPDTPASGDATAASVGEPTEPASVAVVSATPVVVFAEDDAPAAAYDDDADDATSETRLLEARDAMLRASGYLAPSDVAYGGTAEEPAAPALAEADAPLATPSPPVEAPAAPTPVDAPTPAAADAEAKPSPDAAATAAATPASAPPAADEDAASAAPAVLLPPPAVATVVAAPAVVEPPLDDAATSIDAMAQRCNDKTNADASGVCRRLANVLLDRLKLADPQVARKAPVAESMAAPVVGESATSEPIPVAADAVPVVASASPAAAATASADATTANVTPVAASEPAARD